MLKVFRSSPGKFSFATGFISSFLLLFAIIFLQTLNRNTEIAKQKSTASGAVSGVDWVNPASLWQSRRLVDYVLPVRYAGGMYQKGGIVFDDARSSSPRKIVRTGTLQLSVTNPLRSVDEITGIVQQYEGYVVNQQNHTESTSGEEGHLTVRIPAGDFDEVRKRIKASAVRVDEEQQTANDVTKDYFDFEARVRVLHAQEEQYLQILKAAKSVEDTLRVTEKLNEVRGQIEHTQGDFNFLQKTVETSMLEIHLHALPGGRFAALDWHPLLRFREQAGDGLEALGEFAAVLLAILVRLPAVILWVLTAVGLSALAWRLLQRMWRWFAPAKSN